MEKEILRLFKGYLGDKSEVFSKEGLKYGLLIPNTASSIVVKEAIDMYGKKGEEWNNTFHKSFQKVKETPLEILIEQQIVHYITTYGFESLGFYDKDTVYIPRESLEIPELVDDKIEFISIKPMTEEELSKKLMILLTSGIALSKQTISDVMILSDYIDKERFDEISNKEIRIFLYDKYNIMPKNSEIFLRFLIFKLTGRTLKIKDEETIEEMKICSKESALQMLQSYADARPNGYANLASIFLRNKVFFLALKDKEKGKAKKPINAFINKIRRLAVKYHKPLKEDILDIITSKPQNIDLSKSELGDALNNSTIFREIRILNGIKYRIEGNQNILYKIRNGKSYVKKIANNDNEYTDNLKEIYNFIYSHLIKRLSMKVRGKTIYIPNNVSYSAPTSEKQFNGNIPEGSYLEIPRESSFVYGVHWTNLPNKERVDLDLKQMNKSQVFGWDANYKNTNSSIIFSGDMTDAPSPNGATELFYVSKNFGYGAFLLTLNMFTENSQDVPFKFLIAKCDDDKISKNYMVDPNNILETIEMVSKKRERQMVVGFITIGDTIKFYFNDFSSGSEMTSKIDEVTKGAFDYLQSYSKIQLKLKDLLEDAGAILTKENVVKSTIIEKTVDEKGNVIQEIEKEVSTPVDVDLSLNSITKETLIDLLG